MELRLENENDYFEVEALTREAFWDVYRPGCSEHLVLHHLRSADSFIKELDYLCLEANRIVGHIVYSHMFFGPEQNMSPDVIAFGPISVHPAYQRRGIGKKLIEFTSGKAKEMGYKAILITGDYHYYNPLGFVTASRHHIFLPGMPELDEADFFMAKDLEEGYSQGHPGVYGFDKCFEVNDKELAVFDAKFPPKVKRAARDTDLG